MRYYAAIKNDASGIAFDTDNSYKTNTKRQSPFVFLKVYM